MSGASPTLSLIEPGFQVWSKERRGHDGFPLGGVVLDVVDSVDDTTGEVERTFVVVNVVRRQLVERLIPEREADVETLQPFSSSICLKVARALQAANAAEKGVAMGQEIKRARWVATLYGIVGGGAR